MRPNSIARSTAGVALEGLLILAILAAGLLCVGVLMNGTPGDADAALAGGRGHGSQAWLGLSTAQLASTDSAPAVPAGSEYTVVGGGFQPGVGVTINLGEPGCCRFFTVWPSADGTIGFTTTAVGPGTYEVAAYQRFNARKLTLMATLAFDVAG
jgi:hypothetical protein